MPNTWKEFGQIEPFNMVSQVRNFHQISKHQVALIFQSATELWQKKEVKWDDAFEKVWVKWYTARCRKCDSFIVLIWGRLQSLQHRPRIRWRDYIAHLDWEHLGTPLEELEKGRWRRTSGIPYCAWCCSNPVSITTNITSPVTFVVMPKLLHGES